MQREFNPVYASGFAIRDAFYGKITRNTTLNYGFADFVAQVIFHAISGMIGVGVGYHSPLNSMPWIDVKISLRTINAMSGKGDKWFSTQGLLFFLK
jgi:hypothetical protein